MPCYWTEPEQIKGNGTLDYKLVQNPSMPQCRCADTHYRAGLEVLRIDDQNGIVILRLTINDYFEQLVPVEPGEGGTSGSAYFRCGSNNLFVFFFGLPDEIGNYEEGDYWAWSKPK